MTLPTILPSPTTKNTTSDKDPNNTEKEESKLYLPEAEQQYNRKSIAEFKITNRHQSTKKPPTDSFITNLSEPLQFELETIQEHCAPNSKLVEILNGHGAFYNRLIIFLKKTDRFMTEKNFSEEQKTNIEKNINRMLTGGKFDLLGDIGRDLNHLEKSYQDGSWAPSLKDKTFFDKDRKNLKAQEKSGEFHPKWMKKVTLVHGIQASEATLAYWNFRHLESKEDRGRLSDTLIKSRDKALYLWICEFRKFKAALTNPDIGAPSSPSTLTKFHIEAIAARFDYADKVANAEAETDRDFRVYRWDGQSPYTQKHRKQRINQQLDTTQAPSPVLNGIERYSPPSSSSFVEQENTTYFQRASARPKRVSKPNPKYQEHTDEVVIRPRKRKRKSKAPLPTDACEKFYRREKKELLKETGIPGFKDIIQSVLEKEIQRLDPDLEVTLPKHDEHTCHVKRAEVIAAHDELSRLYEACCHHFGIHKSSFTGDMSEKEVSFKSEKEKIKDSLKNKHIPKPKKLPYAVKPPTTSFTDRNQELSKARSALITMIEKSRSLLLESGQKPQKQKTHPDDFGDTPVWRQPLPTVAKFSMPFLTNFFNIENNVISGTQIKERVPTLAQHIQTLIHNYRYNSAVWSPTLAMEALDPAIHEIREIQTSIATAESTFRARQQSLLESAHPTREDINKTEELLRRTHDGLIQTARVLSSLEQFSNHIKSEKHQELYERLSKAIEEWDSCLKDIPLDQPTSQR